MTTNTLVTVDTSTLTPEVKEIHRELVANAAKLSAVMPPGINRDAFLDAVWLANGTEAAIVGFKGEATLIPMVWGIAKRCRQSDEIGALYAHVVYSEDEFDYLLGTNPKIEHRPAITGERGEFQCAYAVAVFKDGMIDIEIMNVEEIEEVRAIAKTDKVWSAWYDEQAKKSVLRRLMKRLPQSADPGGKFQDTWDAQHELEGPGTGNLADHQIPAQADVPMPPEGEEAAEELKDETPRETRAQQAVAKRAARKSPARRKAPAKKNGPQRRSQSPQEEPEWAKGDGDRGPI
jgi:recombinational DNA repair protein RecT